MFASNGVIAASNDSNIIVNDIVVTNDSNDSNTVASNHQILLLTMTYLLPDRKQ